MKLIEALKKIKELQRKAEDLRELVKENCAISSIETALYPDQKAKVSGWIQSHSDLMKEILSLRIAIQKTNLETDVTIEVEGKKVKKSIAEWIHRRRDLAAYELDMWNKLSDRNIREGQTAGPGGQIIDLRIVRFYDAEERDKKRAALQEEPTIIDSKLEVINAITDLIE